MIKAWVNELTLKPGINSDLFKLSKSKKESMSDFEKECVLMWDEMSIRPYLEYNQKEDYIEGFSDLGEYGRTGELANIALTFMLSGLSCNWKQAVYFSFSKGSFLFKWWRNNLINNNYVIEDETVSWAAIRELRELERLKSSKAAPKLTDRYLDPNNFQKMNVKLAVQVFNGSVSRAMMAGFATKELHNPNCVSTAQFLWSMNSIFDCLNAQSPNDQNPLNRGLCDSRPQVEITLHDAIPWIETIQINTQTAL